MRFVCLVFMLGAFGLGIIPSSQKVIQDRPVDRKIKSQIISRDCPRIDPTKGQIGRGTGDGPTPDVEYVKVDAT